MDRFDAAESHRAVDGGHDAGGGPVAGEEEQNPGTRDLDEGIDRDPFRLLLEEHLQKFFGVFEVEKNEDLALHK